MLSPDRIFYRDKFTPAQKVFLFPLYLASLSYGLLMRLRAAAYKRGLCSRVDPEIPVISVGNLSVGGTGKTPVTHFLATRLLALGRRPVVVSRGYKGSLEGRIALVADGENIFLDAASAGDEALQTARALPGVPVVIGARRPEAVNFAQAKTQAKTRADVAVCDDAFQHLRLARRLNILCVDGARGFGNHLCLPLGPLREPLAALARADVILVNDTLGQRQDIASIARRHGFRGPVMPWRYQAGGFRRLAGGEDLPLGALEKCSVHAFAATAHPEDFFDFLRGLGIELAAVTKRPDHHVWRREDFEKVAGGGFTYHLGTEKDAAKMEGFQAADGLPILILSVKPEFSNGDIARIDAMIRERI